MKAQDLLSSYSAWTQFTMARPRRGTSTTKSPSDVQRPLLVGHRTHHHSNAHSEVQVKFISIITAHEAIIGPNSAIARCDLKSGHIAFLGQGNWKRFVQYFDKLNIPEEMMAPSERINMAIGLKIPFIWRWRLRVNPDQTISHDVILEEIE